MVKLLLGVIFQTWELQHVRATFESIFPLQDIFFPASLFVATGGVGTFLHLSLGLRRHSSRWWITIHLTTLLGSVPWLIEEWQDVMWKCDRTSGWMSFWEVCGLISKYDVSWGTQTHGCFTELESNAWWNHGEKRTLALHQCGFTQTAEVLGRTIDKVARSGVVDGVSLWIWVKWFVHREGEREMIVIV